MSTDCMIGLWRAFVGNERHDEMMPNLAGLGSDIAAQEEAWSAYIMISCAE